MCQHVYRLSMSEPCMLSCDVSSRRALRKSVFIIRPELAYLAQHMQTTV